MLQQFECSGRTALGAFSAGCAECKYCGILKLRLNDSVKASAYKAKDALAYFLVADPYAETAQEAFALVSLDGLKALLGEARMLLAGIS